MMTQREIDTLVQRYIGINSGYLIGFSYHIHDTFYERYCGLQIDVRTRRANAGTTRETFIEILGGASAKDQAKIIRGVFEMIPPPEKAVNDADRHKLQAYEQLNKVATRLEAESQSLSGKEPNVARKYYSARIGRGKIDIIEVLYLKLLDLYSLFRDRDFFRQKADITIGNVPKTIKYEASLALPFQPFPISEWDPLDISEDRIFDTLEFLYDYVSKPGQWRQMESEDGQLYAGYDGYDESKGRAEFREKANIFLSDYKGGYELTDDGKILALGSDGLRDILSAEILPYDEANVDSKVRSAIAKWRNRQLSVPEKKEAIREMADVFEWLKKTKKLGSVLDHKDESAIFDLANNFAIRHHNPGQKKNYDQGIWYSWIFHFYLATYHASVRLLIKHEK